jgi:hypothetical protein
MVVNVPWGEPFENWNDRMIERGLRYLDGSLDKGPDGEGSEFFPHTLKALGDEASARGIELDAK